MTEKANVISWFEIPVADFTRAKAFYETLLGKPVMPMEMGSTTMGFLSDESDSVGGAIVDSDQSSPSQQGTVVYLNGGSDLTAMLDRVAGAGGTVVIPKTDIGSGFGFFAQFHDTEGNTVGLYSQN